MPYYGRGDCDSYGRGDYYRGDYYRGDPGIFGTLKKVAGKVGGALHSVGIGGPVTAALARLQTPGAPAGTALVPAAPMQIRTVIPNVPAPLQLETMGTGGLIAVTQDGRVCQVKGTHVNRSGYYRHPPGQPQNAQYVPPRSTCVRNRKLNPANGRAARRALSRLYAFKRMAMRTIRLVDAGKSRKKFGGFKRKKGAR